MTEEEFSTLDLPEKWSHIKRTMDYIMEMDSKYIPEYIIKKYSNQQTNSSKKEQRNLRMDQYQRWEHLKNLYGAHRDELVDTMGIPAYEDAKNIIERMFTMEIDDALYDIINK